MEELQLSEPLQRYFSDIFLLCDEENSEKASVLKTIELIRSANVPEHIIDEISEIICWNQSTANLNKKEFFSALKLVAAYQSNRSLSSDLVTANIDLPLPKFTWNNLGNESPIPDLIELSNDLNVYREHIDTTSTDSEFDSDTLSLNRNGSPEVSSTASDSPTPTNSVQDRNWAGRGWQGLISEEQRQLLGTEEELSDKHSSEDETEVMDDVWTITPEQCTYYIKQFKTLQPDLTALLPGPVARTFFEKSRLPVHTLRKIWQLADVTKDGALSLQEFMTAMHLVVLKRNNIEIPDVLPPGLIPGNNENPKSPSPETEPILSPPVPPPTKETAKEWTKFVESPTSSIASPGPKPVNFDFQKVSLDKDPKILHPKPLRLTPENPGTSNDETREISDGPSPSKFSDSNSLTIGHNLNSSNVNSQTQNSAIQRPQPKKIVVKGAIPPPPTNQSSVEEGPVSLPAFPPPKKDKPPPPPPRSFKTHGRSSSLDLNRLTKVPVVPPRVSPSINSSKKLMNQRSEGDQAVSAPVDNQEAEASFANFEQFEKYENVQEGVFPGSVYEAERKKLFAQFSAPETSEETGPRRHGAFEVYRKPNKGKDSPVSNEEKLKWDVFQKMQEENTVLLRLCQELSQELADIREEKLALKVRLEKLMNGG
ncbi:ralBP1-associated Eps domain-containing protein 1 [Coccinella septempunctata]|uniref:ralBP1-associated Eps domain-containing protein 1 n=1 Tax=Coccinella septempunctata TaxID=41139 RepID=UPI001D068E4A|nr:ralBP1-associated Eps domain-containing protein 1 [Coccinella septempunctata]